MICKKSILIFPKEEEAEIYMKNDGSVGALDNYGKGGRKRRKDQAHVVTISINCAAGTISIYVDGELSAKIENTKDIFKDGRFSLNKQICLFGSKEMGETL